MVITPLECWQDALVLRYWEFALSDVSAEAEALSHRGHRVIVEFFARLRGLSRPDREEALEALSDLDDMRAVEEAFGNLRSNDSPDLREVLEAIREAGEKDRREEGRREIPEDLDLRPLARRQSRMRGMAGGWWEAHDDVGVSYRWAGARSGGNSHSREGTVTFNPSLSPNAKEFTLVPRIRKVGR